MSTPLEGKEAKTKQLLEQGVTLRQRFGSEIYIILKNVMTVARIKSLGQKVIIPKKPPVTVENERLLL